MAYIVLIMLTVIVVIGDTEHRHGAPIHRHGNGLDPHADGSQRLLGPFRDKPSIRACQLIDASGENFRLVFGPRRSNGPFLLISSLAIVMERSH